MRLVVDPLARSLMEGTPGNSPIKGDRYTLLSQSEQCVASGRGQAEPHIASSASCQEESLQALNVCGYRKSKVEASNAEHRVLDSWRPVFEKQGRAGAMGMHVM